MAVARHRFQSAALRGRQEKDERSLRESRAQWSAHSRKRRCRMPDGQRLAVEKGDADRAVIAASGSRAGGVSKCADQNDRVGQVGKEARRAKRGRLKPPRFAPRAPKVSAHFFSAGLSFFSSGFLSSGLASFFSGFFSSG